MKKMPKFKNCKEEASFWENKNSVEYIDWSKAHKAIFPNLKPSAETISLRLPISLLSEIKSIAHKKDVPYQSLIKVMLTHEINLLRENLL